MGAKTCAGALTLVASINETEMKNDWEVDIPWVLGLIGTRSVDKTLPGIVDIKNENRTRIVRGIESVKTLEALRKNPQNASLKAKFETQKADLGYGLLLRKYVTSMDQVTPEIVEKAVDDTIPAVTPMFWGFRVMVGLGFMFLALFAASFFYSVKGTFDKQKWLLRWAFWCLPLPWVASEVGWFVAEYGRQPWTIYGVLPTHMSVSALSVESLYGSLAGFVGFYTVLLITEMYLMFKFVRLGRMRPWVKKADWER